MVSEAANAPDFERTYGKYRLLEKVASGGMAEVFKALSTSIGGFRKVVAVKRILPQFSSDAEFVSLFIDEAKLTVALSHSNIVQVFDFGRIDGNYYIAMEFVDGRDLTRVLVKQARRGGVVPVEVGCYVVALVLRGLEYANSRRGSDGELLGIVHRDVSPHNILVSFDGEVKVADFGIAKARTKVSLTRPGVVLGKFAYMSPEQARGEEVDARSDVYSAAIALFETITGRRLFYAENPSEVLAKVRQPRVPRPSLYNAGIGERLDEILLRALAPEPEHRYETCRAFATDLEGHLLDSAPGFNDSHLVSFMKDLFEDEVGATKFAMAALRPIEPSFRVGSRSLASVAQRRGPWSDHHAPHGSQGSLGEPVLLALMERLRQTPDLWTLYDLAEALRSRDRLPEAQAVYRTAAAKFAQSGLFAQAVAMYVRLRELLGWNADMALEVEAVRQLPGCPNDAIAARRPSVGDVELDRLLEWIALHGEPTWEPGLVAPLFGELDAAEFANIVSLLQLRSAALGEAIMCEGEPGDWLGIIARGRVVIFCEGAREKVYLSSLSDGDCIGEFSFFTQEPRAATVEALEQVLYLQVGRVDFDRLSERFPAFTSALSRFYTQRVVVNILAKSEIFGGLKPSDRAALLEEASGESFEAGEVILREGDASDCFYVVQLGLVEVYSARPRLGLLRRLGPGSFFGETGAVTGRPRTASVRALAPTRVLRIPREAIADVMRRHPDVRANLERHMALREAERLSRLTGGGVLV